MHRFVIKLRKLILGPFSQEIVNPVQDFSLKKSFNSVLSLYTALTLCKKSKKF